MPKRLTTLQRYAQRSRAAKVERSRQIFKLKSLGLISKKANLKSAVTRRNLREKYIDVLQRRATVLTVPKGFSIKGLKKSFRVEGLNVVVKHAKGERVRLEKSGRITTTRKVAGERVKRILHFGGKMPKPGKGKKFMYAVNFSGGQRVRFESLQELTDFMNQYDPNSKSYVKGNYANWRDYMEIEEVAADDDGDDGEE